MYKTDFPASESENVRRVAQNILGEDVQHIENINIEENKNVRRVAQTGNTDILDRYLRAVDENNTLIRENADLRIQLERKDSRIRDLEMCIRDSRECVDRGLDELFRFGFR